MVKLIRNMRAVLGGAAEARQQQEIEELFERLAACIPSDTRPRAHRLLEGIAFNLAERRTGGEALRFEDELRALGDALGRWAWQLELDDRRRERESARESAA